MGILTSFLGLKFAGVSLEALIVLGLGLVAIGFMWNKFGDYIGTNTKKK